MFLNPRRTAVLNNDQATFLVAERLETQQIGEIAIRTLALVTLLLFSVSFLVLFGS